MTAAAPAYRVQLPWCAVRRSASLVIEGSKMNASLSLEALSYFVNKNSDANRIAGMRLLALNSSLPDLIRQPMRRLCEH